MKYNKEQEYKIIHLLRYRNQQIDSIQRTYMTLNLVGKFIRRSHQYVHNACQQLLSGAIHNNGADSKIKNPNIDDSTDEN